MFSPAGLAGGQHTFFADYLGDSLTSSSISNSAAVTLTDVPVLALALTHAASFQQGQNGAKYVVVATNIGSLSTSGTVSVTDSVPSGLTLVSMAGSGWTCLGNTCTRNDSLNPGFSYPPITAIVNVAANAPSLVINTVGIAGGAAASASASDLTLINPGPHTSVLPAAGTGSAQAFTFTYTDSGGFQNIVGSQIVSTPR